MPSDPITTAIADYLRRSVPEQIEALRVAGKEDSSRVVPALIELLAYPDLNVRAQAVRALGDIGDARAVGALRQQLELSETLRSEAAEALLAIGPAAAPAVQKSLRARSPQARVVATHLVATFGGRGAVGALRRALQDDVTAVRLAAVSALGRLGGPAVVSALGTALSDSELEVRTRVVELLREAEGEVVPLLCRVLNDPDPQLRSLAGRSMVQLTIDDPDLAEELARLHSYPAANRHSSEQLIDRRAVPHLLLALRYGCHPVRYRAAALLGRIAERLPSAELSAAMPDLRSLLRQREGETDESRRIYRHAHDTIERATAQLRRLPIPAQPAGKRRDLPVVSSDPGPDLP